MITVINTGDRDSDLFHWSSIHAQLSENLQSFDCSIPIEVAKLEQVLSTISLFNQQQAIVIHRLEPSERIIHLISEYPENVYLVTLTGKGTKKLPANFSSSYEKITDTYLKTHIYKGVGKLSYSIEKDDLQKILLSLSEPDAFTGKVHISPTRTGIFLRQLEAVQASPAAAQKELITYLIGTVEDKASQWEILDNLFSPSKRIQHEYFSQLGENMAIFEIMNLAKSSLLVVLGVLAGKTLGFDNASIASKIGKHPFYVGSLARTIEYRKITQTRALKLLTCLLNLEMTLKSGKLDDETLGFAFLLATAT